MVSIKVKFRSPAKTGDKGTIYYQITYKQKTRRISSGHHIYPHQWDNKRFTTLPTQCDDNNALDIPLKQRIQIGINRVNAIEQKLSSRATTFTVNDIIDEYNSYTNEYSISNYTENIILQLQLRNRIRTAETYRATLRSFQKFIFETYHFTDIIIDEMTHQMTESYEAWLKSRGIVPNTISFYLRILRALYNRAVNNGIFDNGNPFIHVYTGVDKTTKRALSISTLKQILSLDLCRRPALDFARDIFMLSFYLRGMSFIDMSFLLKSDLKNNHITYRRRKTGQELSIEWTPEMQEIIDKYPANDSRFLLPIIRHDNGNERKSYLNASYSINRNLKKIGKMANIDIPLTLYVARHSWASAAKTNGIPLSVISEGMGHDSETTTQIYLASLDADIVDRANALILQSLK